MLSLKSAGIVYSTRGSKGGYVLAKSLSEISLSTIVGVTDSRLTESVLQGNGSNGEFPSETEKLLGEVWGEVGETIQEKLESISIDDLCVRVKTARANSIPDYVI